LNEEEEKMDWKDYLAIVIALLQTVLLPYIIILMVFIASIFVVVTFF